jgi:serine/threonine-protein kinase RsbW
MRPDDLSALAPQRPSDTDGHVLDAARSAAAARRRPVRVRSSTTLPVEPTAPATARHHVLDVLRTNAAAGIALDVVELLVSEVVTNVLRHETSRSVDVDVEIDPGQGVTVTVAGNESTSTLPHLAPAGAQDAFLESGRGLRILDALATSWGIRRADGRTAVWFTIRETTAVAADH